MFLKKVDPPPFQRDPKGNKPPFGQNPSVLYRACDSSALDLQLGPSETPSLAKPRLVCIKCRAQLGPPPGCPKNQIGVCFVLFCLRSVGRVSHTHTHMIRSTKGTNLGGGHTCLHICIYIYRESTLHKISLETPASFMVSCTSAAVPQRRVKFGSGWRLSPDFQPARNRYTGDLGLWPNFQILNHLDGFLRVHPVVSGICIYILFCPKSRIHQLLFPFGTSSSIVWIASELTILFLWLLMRPKEI